MSAGEVQAEAGEVDPAEDVLQRLAGGPARDETREVVGVRGRGKEQVGLLLGVDAAGGSEGRRHLGTRRLGQDLTSAPGSAVPPDRFA